MNALNDPQTFELHDIAERDVREDPYWRELMGIDDEEDAGEA